MSAFSEYAAECEAKTSLNRNAPIRDLDTALTSYGYETPTSGDMLAVLQQGTRTQQYRRRLRIRNRLHEETP